MPAYKNGDLDLWKVNILTGQGERLALGKSGTFYWYTDKAGNPVLRFDCVGRRCRKINVFTHKGYVNVKQGQKTRRRAKNSLRQIDSSYLLASKYY